MSTHAGRTGVVYIAIESVTGVATSTISLNAWTINRATDKFEVTSFAGLGNEPTECAASLHETIFGKCDKIDREEDGDIRGILLDLGSIINEGRGKAYQADGYQGDVPVLCENAGAMIYQDERCYAAKERKEAQRHF